MLRSVGGRSRAVAAAVAASSSSSSSSAIAASSASASASASVPSMPVPIAHRATAYRYACRHFSSDADATSSSTASSSSSSFSPTYSRYPRSPSRAVFELSRRGPIEATVRHQTMQWMKKTEAGQTGSDAVAVEVEKSPIDREEHAPTQTEQQAAAQHVVTSGYRALEFSEAIVATGKATTPLTPVDASFFRSKSTSRTGYSPSSRHNIAISPRKLNDVCRIVRGLSVAEAMIQLQISSKQKAAPIIRHVIATAAAHAVNTHNMERSRLYVAECWVGSGSHLKRIDIKARGRSGIKKRYRTHLYVRVAEQGADPAQYLGRWAGGGYSHSKSGEEIRIGRKGRKISSIERTLREMKEWRQQRGLSPTPSKEKEDIQNDAKKVFRAMGTATPYEDVYGPQPALSSAQQQQQH